jgi:hypothetical protein
MSNNKDYSNLVKRLEEIMVSVESEAEGEPSTFAWLLSEIIATIEEQDTKIAELSSALKPFAKAGSFTKSYEYSADTEMAIHFTYAEFSAAYATWKKINE